MKLAVLLYQFAENPNNIPNIWPCTVLEINDDENLPGNDWITMSKNEYKKYISD